MVDKPPENQSPSPKPEPGKSPDGKPPQRVYGPHIWLLVAALTVMAVILFISRQPKRSSISFSFFQEQLENENIDGMAFVGKESIQGSFKEPPADPGYFDSTTGQLHEPKKDSEGNPVSLEKLFQVSTISLSDDEREEIRSIARTKAVQVASDKEAPNGDALMMFLLFGLPLLLFFMLWMMFRRTRDQIMGGGILSGFSKSPARLYEGVHQGITFDDVAGLESVKEDLKEVVEFLKYPEKFRKLGARVPKGILLNGPPGTGKTLLARAVAGEADVPFYSVTGSEFIQMFVGVGASRVRDLFKIAKENAPAIIFIDEIDAVGRQRGAGLGGGHDEREQTLNQILSEMDGFAVNDSVIVLAASNRPDVLDPALLRPGRFDRHVTVDRPTRKGRREIFKVHVRDVPLDDDVDLNRLAAGTVGLTGADIRNLVNEAALWATRQSHVRVTMEDFEYARDKILMGPKREEVLLEDEKEKTAYHEAGHALLAWLSRGSDRVHKVTVIPRGRALGVTQLLPEEDQMNISQSDLADRLAFLMGGRAAEQIVYDEFSAGAENDLERATRIVRRMVSVWGMSERIGPVSYKLSDEDPFLGREIHEHRQFSEHTLQIIDEEVARLLHEAAERAKQILVENRDKLDKLAHELVEREELNESEIAELIGPSVHQQKLDKDKEEKAATSGDGEKELAAKRALERRHLS